MAAYKGYSNEADYLADTHGITIMPQLPLAWLRKERLWQLHSENVTQGRLAAQHNVALGQVSGWDRGHNAPNRAHQLMLAETFHVAPIVVERAVKLTHACGKAYFAIIDAIKEGKPESEWKPLIPVYNKALEAANAWILEQCKKDDMDPPAHLVQLAVAS